MEKQNPCIHNSNSFHSLESYMKFMLRFRQMGGIIRGNIETLSNLAIERVKV